MVDMGGTRTADDPYNLRRFLAAQQVNYDQALSEIRSGRKLTHWMWYVFPQLDGLAFSSTSKLYAIKSLEEARAYLDHPVLGPRLLDCAEAAVRVEGRSERDLRLAGRPEAQVLRHPFRARIASRLRVPSPPRQVLPGRG